MVRSWRVSNARTKEVNPRGKYVLRLFDGAKEPWAAGSAVPESGSRWEQSGAACSISASRNTRAHEIGKTSAPLLSKRV